MKLKGDVISEQELMRRINVATQDIMGDVDGTIRLHNLICKGEVAVYESEGGEPLDVHGKVASEPETEAWGYIFTKAE